MVDAVEAGSLSIEKLEAMTSVCSVGLDMIAVPGDTSDSTISGILADEIAIGVMNCKTRADPCSSSGDTELNRGESMKAVRVRVPATTANLGPAFDAAGMALDLYNEVSIAESTGLVVEVCGEGSESLPEDASNLVYRAIEKVAVEAGQPVPPLRIKCTNRIPLSRGMGSSAAAIVAGIVGVDALLHYGLGDEEILRLAVQLEGHPDNVAPALFGGLVVSCLDGQENVCCIDMPAPTDLTAVLAIPDYHLSTSKARAVLPEAVSREDAVFNVSRVALLVAALQFSRHDLLAVAMRDRLHQPYRAQLVPGLSEVLQSALEAGAAGAAMSGAGPTVVALCPGAVDSSGGPVGDAMAQAFHRHGVACSITVARPTDSGALVNVEHLPSSA